jgi:transcriptional regulator with XRE-family HTH domain
MTYSDVIRRRLEYLIDQRGITVNRLATLSGITQSTVENIVHGKTRNPKLKTLHRLACGLDMTVSELLDFPEMDETIFDDE